MNSIKYIGLDVHKETISIAVMNAAGKIVMESIIETKAATILQFEAGLGDFPRFQTLHHNGKLLFGDSLNSRSSSDLASWRRP